MLQLQEIWRDGYAERFVDDWKGGKCPRYLFGTNQLAGDLAETMDADGFINTVSELAEFKGKPVVHSLEDVPEDSLVVACNVLGKINQVDAWLSQYSFRHLEAPRFVNLAGIQVKITYFSGFAEDILVHLDAYRHIFERLEDMESRNVFYNLVNYRLSGSWRYLRGFADLRGRQYFEDFLELSPETVFADIGGYHGETSLEFIKRNPDYGRIHFFEPEPDNLKCAQEVLKDFRDIEFIEKACSNRKGKVSFIADGSASKIIQNSIDSDRCIDANLFDDMVSGRVDFIKMDIEGAEGTALAGMERSIQKWHPTLAVCVYHRPDDFRVLPKQVLDIRDDYRVFMRHYSEGVTETVMFFMP